jgi:hypothetical protein
MNRENRLPDFLIIGVAKSGTTTLSNFLISHPEAAIAKVKEPHFFSYKFVFDRGIPWYAALFKDCGQAKVIGEASTSYSRVHQHPWAVQNIRNTLPNVKIIMMVRHPLDRILSAFIEWLGTPNHNQVFTSINEALVQMPTFLEASRYWRIYETYAAAFGANNIHVVWFDDLVKDQHKAFAEVCRFLTIDDEWTSGKQTIQANPRSDAASRAKEFGRDLDQIDLIWNQSSRDLFARELEEDISIFLKHFGREGLWPDLF